MSGNTGSVANGDLTAGSCRSVAPFLQKTFDLISDKSNKDILSWCSEGKSFYVRDHNKLVNTLLPKVFKHSNWSSFARQLNTYGFRKVVNGHQLYFEHDNFRENHPELLKLITRRTAPQKVVDPATSLVETEDFSVNQKWKEMHFHVQSAVNQQRDINHTVQNLNHRMRSADAAISQTLTWLDAIENRADKLESTLRNFVKNVTVRSKTAEQKGKTEPQQGEAKRKGKTKGNIDTVVKESEKEDTSDELPGKGVVPPGRVRNSSIQSFDRVMMPPAQRNREGSGLNFENLAAMPPPMAPERNRQFSGFYDMYNVQAAMMNHAMANGMVPSAPTRKRNLSSLYEGLVGLPPPQHSKRLMSSIFGIENHLNSSPANANAN